MSKKIWQVTVKRKSSRLRSTNVRHFTKKKDAEDYIEECEHPSQAGMEVWTNLEQVNETILDCTMVRLAAVTINHPT